MTDERAEVNVIEITQMIRHHTGEINRLTALLGGGGAQSAPAEEAPRDLIEQQAAMRIANMSRSTFSSFIKRHTEIAVYQRDGKKKPFYAESAIRRALYTKR